MVPLPNTPEDREEVMQENDVDKMTARQLEQAVQEKKKLKKRLAEEQEYSNKLQKSIQEKEQEIKEYLAKTYDISEKIIDIN